MSNKTIDQHEMVIPMRRSLIPLLVSLSIAVLVMKCARPLSSLDLWWHIAFGKYMLTTGNLIIDHSLFTWTAATSHHTYNAWIAEIVLYLIYVNLGPFGLIALGYLVHGSFFALAAYFASKRGIGSNPLTWVIITVGIALSFIATIVQPELFSFALMYITVWLYFKIRADGTTAWKLCYLFPLIITLWVNSHGGFVIGSVFFVVVGIGELLNTALNSKIAMPKQLTKHLFFAFLLCILALLINPFGYQLSLQILETAFVNTNEVTGLSDITGFSSTYKYNAPPYHAIDYLLIAMCIYVFLLWQSLKNGRTDWVVILAILVYSLIFTTLLRTTHFLAPVFVFSSLDLLAQKQNSWAWPLTKKSNLLIAVCCLIIISFIGWRTTKGVMCHAYAGNLWASTNIKASIPVEEVAYIEKMPAVTKVGNTYQDGGYIMYKLWPTALGMIDTRYFPFKTWFSRYLKFHRGEDIKTFVDSYQPDVWLINHSENTLIDWFSKSKVWIPLFIGPAGIVFGNKNNLTATATISPNLAHTDSIIHLKELFQTAFLLQNLAIAERVQAQVAAIANNRYACKQYKELDLEMQNFLSGSKAILARDYKTAIIMFNRNRHFLQLDLIGINIATMLAKYTWDNNDYLNARKLTMEIVRLNPTDTISLYNAIITDWQYRQASIMKITPDITDDITWQFLVNILLSHQEKIPPTMRNYMVSVFTAMQNGTLHEKPTFIAQ